MKRTLSKGLSLLLAMVLCLALGACGNNGTSQESQEPQVEPVVKMEDGTVHFNLTAEEFHTKFNETAENENEKIGDWTTTESDGQTAYIYSFSNGVYLFAHKDQEHQKIASLACLLDMSWNSYDTDFFLETARSMVSTGAQTLDLAKSSDIVNRLDLSKSNSTRSSFDEGEFNYQSFANEDAWYIWMEPVDAEGGDSNQNISSAQGEPLLPTSAAAFQEAFNSIATEAPIEDWFTSAQDSGTSYLADLGGGILVILSEDKGQQGLRYATCQLDWEERDANNNAFGETILATLYAACPDLDNAQMGEVLEGLKLLDGQTDVWLGTDHKEFFELEGYYFSMEIDADTWSLMIFAV